MEGATNQIIHDAAHVVAGRLVFHAIIRENLVNGYFGAHEEFRLAVYPSALNRDSVKENSHLALIAGIYKCNEPSRLIELRERDA